MKADELAELARGIGQATDDNDVVRMLASLVAASHEFLGVADPEGNALFVNEAGRRLVGLRDLKAVQSTQVIDYFFRAGRPPKVLQEVLPAVRATGFWQGELKFSKFSGDRRAGAGALYNIFPIRDFIRRHRRLRNNHAQSDRSETHGTAIAFTGVNCRIQ